MAENHGFTFFSNITSCFSKAKKAVTPGCFLSNDEKMTPAKVEKLEKVRSWCKRGSYINVPSALGSSYLQLRLPNERSLLAFSLTLMVISFIRLIVSAFLQMKEGSDSRDNQLTMCVNFTVMMLSMLTFCNGVIITAFKEDGFDEAWLTVQEEVQYAIGFVLVTLVSGEMSYFMLSGKPTMPTSDDGTAAAEAEEDDLEASESLSRTDL